MLFWQDQGSGAVFLSVFYEAYDFWFILLTSDDFDHMIKVVPGSFSVVQFMFFPF